MPTQVNIRVSNETKALWDSVAERTHTTLSDLIRDAMDAYLRVQLTVTQEPSPATEPAPPPPAAQTGTQNAQRAVQTYYAADQAPTNLRVNPSYANSARCPIEPTGLCAHRNIIGSWCRQGRGIVS